MGFSDHLWSVIVCLGMGWGWPRWWGRLVRGLRIGQGWLRWLRVRVSESRDESSVVEETAEGIVFRFIF